MYWADMRHAAVKILNYTQGMNENELVRDADLKNLEIIGEAAKKWRSWDTKSMFSS